MENRGKAMIKINDNVEIEKYAHGWELHVYREKQMSRRNPDEIPTGKACDKSWHGTFEQACAAAFDKMMPDDMSDLEQIKREIRSARDAITQAIGATVI